MSAPRKILFYNHTRQVSGAERILLNMIAVLDRRQYQVAAACPVQGAGELDELLRARGCRLIEAPLLQARFTSNPLRLLGYLGSFARAILRFRRTVLRENPDLLHANSVRAGIVATLATLGTRIRVLWHIQDDLPRHPLSTAVRVLALTSRRTGFAAVSAATARAFAGRFAFGRRLHVLPNGLDLECFPPRTDPLDEAAAAVRRELGLSARDRLAVTVGMINPRKGLLPLVQAWRSLADELAAQAAAPAYLAIVGAPIFNNDQVYEAQLRERIEELGLTDQVRLLGARKEVAAILRAADLFILNATVEPFGLVIVEAMACGTPVLASAIGGIPEIVEDGVSGRLFGSSASDGGIALAAALVQAVRSPQELESLAAHAQVMVRERFSLSAFGANLHALYGSPTLFGAGR